MSNMKRRTRCRNFTQYERLMFAEVLKPFGSVLEKSSDPQAKTVTWMIIKNEFNKRAETGIREDFHLRMLYDSMKKQFRRDLAAFKGDVGLMFTHPEIEESRKSLNKKIWAACGETLLRSRPPGGYTFEAVSSDSNVLANSSRQDDDQDSDSASQDDESTKVVEIEVKCEAQMECDDVPDEEEPKFIKDTEPLIMPVKKEPEETTITTAPLQASKTEPKCPQPIPKQIRVVPALGGFQRTPNQLPVVTKEQLSRLNFTTLVYSPIRSLQQNSPTPNPALPRIRMLTTSEINEQHKNASANKRVAGNVRVSSEGDRSVINPPSASSLIDLSEESVSPKKVKISVYEETERELKLDILRIQKNKEEIERDILLLIKEKKEIDVEKKKLELEQYRKQCANSFSR